MTVQESISALRAYADGYAGNIRGMCAIAANLIETLAADRESAMQDASDFQKELNEMQSKKPRWISVEERLPENDVPVLVSAKRKRWNGKEYRIVFTAFHTDGTTYTEDSGYGWDTDSLGLKYCEETDDYIVPEAWWEDVRYGEEFSKVYDTVVTHWMPLPEPPKEPTS